MRPTTLLAPAAAALLLAGCGSQQNPGSGDTAPPPARTGTPSPTRAGGPCAAHLELTAADQGRTVCVTEGGEVRVTLDGTPDRPWRPVAADGTGLKAVNPGFVRRPGDATAAYRAVAAGTVTLTSSRPLCPEPTAPDQVSCMGIEAWTVTVRIR